MAHTKRNMDRDYPREIQTRFPEALPRENNGRLTMSAIFYNPRGRRPRGFHTPRLYLRKGFGILISNVQQNILSVSVWVLSNHCIGAHTHFNSWVKSK